jgi:hypothetical protein
LSKLIFGWSFYRQGSSGETSSADQFFEAALIWFGDPDPRIGTAWEKGERLAKLFAHRRTLLVLDGREPLQNPPGPKEGRVREPSLQALLRELAAFNTGLCVITTRLPVTDLAEHAGIAVLGRDLEQLSGDTGARLLRALGVKGQDAEVAMGMGEPDDYKIAPTKHADSLEATAAALSKIIRGSQLGTAASQDDREIDFDLVEPAGVDRSMNEDYAGLSVAQPVEAFCSR